MFPHHIGSVGYDFIKQLRTVKTGQRIVQWKMLVVLVSQVVLSGEYYTQLSGSSGRHPRVCFQQIVADLLVRTINRVAEAAGIQRRFTVKSDLQIGEVADMRSRENAQCCVEL